MINSIFVTGYKSLNDFSMTLRPGLNVLVGPNGSGKSNILSLFEFMSYASKYSLAEAVSRSGGAGTIFSRTVDQNISNSIRIQVSGYGRHSPPRRRYAHPSRQTPDYYVEYEYHATIQLSEKGTSLVYGEQRLCFSAFTGAEQRTLFNRQSGQKRWHVDLITQIDKDNRRLFRRNKVNRVALNKIQGMHYTKVDNFHINYAIDIASQPLFSVLSGYFPPMQKVLQDISSGYIYNLNPNAIKQSEDIAHLAEISADGSGLAATLFSIQEDERQGAYRYVFVDADSEPRPKVTLSQLREMFCLINDNIIDVRVENAALENKLVVVAKVENGTGTIEVPLAMLSDGTVKWFSLVTAVLRERAIFSLEEPENYLHPYMQREIVDILRRSTEDNSERFSLMTTHSETLLNALDPMEVAVVAMRGGRTTVTRSAHPDELRDEINRSGFGLGHLYVAGAV